MMYSALSGNEHQYIPLYCEDAKRNPRLDSLRAIQEVGAKSPRIIRSLLTVLVEECSSSLFRFLPCLIPCFGGLSRSSDFFVRHSLFERLDKHRALFWVFAYFV